MSSLSSSVFAFLQDNSQEDEFSSRWKMIDLLRAHGAQLTLRDSFGMTPLYECIDRGILPWLLVPNISVF